MLKLNISEFTRNLWSGRRLKGSMKMIFRYKFSWTITNTLNIGVGPTVFQSKVFSSNLNNFAENYKSSSLRTNFQMIKKPIEQIHKIDINYPELLSFLKETLVGYFPKKANIFEQHHLKTFLSDAPDDDYLLMKVSDVIPAKCPKAISFSFVQRSLGRPDFYHKWSWPA